MMNRFTDNSSTLIIARIVLAFSWVYQGAVPKVICKSPEEIELLEHVIKTHELACSMVTWMGYGEIAFGIILLFTARGWIFLLNILALILLLGYVVVFQPDLLTMPFNPLILNVSLIGISLIAYNELRKSKDFGER